ncbi:hypothetical protein AVEN_194085-1 [Araneus ventricosus]|uniref:Uncharacterized protein n=1 Tax=Araneus ventricosus TaxID=182803 RepID=A0A4Y2JCZ7_ARAVE|nr:hypothetical protein AVEN_194085-1 [Araneus ventricosus]
MIKLFSTHHCDDKALRRIIRINASTHHCDKVLSTHHCDDSFEDDAKLRLWVVFPFRSKVKVSFLVIDLRYHRLNSFTTDELIEDKLRQFKFKV